jgi:hypothetical protein
LDGWHHEDPPTSKKLPVKSDVPEYLVNESGHRLATALDQAVVDLTTIAFYYLLCVGEYTVKRNKKRNKAHSTIQNGGYNLLPQRQIGTHHVFSTNHPPSRHPHSRRGNAKIRQPNNGHKGVCVYQQTTGDPIHCPVCALGQRYQHLSENKATGKTFICAYWMDNEAYNVTADDISTALKRATTLLQYPLYWGIPIKRINTHSLRIGGACALALNGFSEMHIQKMGRWRGDTFKEYIREELHCFSDGMSKAMKQCFKFINVTGHALTEVTNQIVNKK